MYNLHSEYFDSSFEAILEAISFSLYDKVPKKLNWEYSLLSIQFPTTELYIVLCKEIKVEDVFSL